MKTQACLAFAAVLLATACGNEGNTTAAAAPAPGNEKPSGPGGPPARARAQRGPEHAVFSLVDNRLLAHAHRGGALVVLPGSPGFAKYLKFARPKIAWKMGQKVDGRRVGVADLYASFEAPLTAEQAAAAKSVTIRLSSPVARRLGLKVNGKDVGTTELTGGWQTVTLAVPDGQLKAGENQLQLISAKGENAAVEWIQIGGSAAGDAAPAVYDEAKKALVLPKGDGLSYYVQVPQDGRLVGTVLGSGCRVAVRAKGHEGKAVEGVLESDGAVELGALEGKIVRLDLTGDGCAEAKLADAALAVPGDAAKVQKGKKPKYIVFWIMDSLRADRVRTFHPTARPDVPNFDKFATVGTIFLNNYTQGNESQASHASIWTSLYVSNHRLIPGGVKRVDDAKYVTLGEAMKAAGFYTSGVSANGYIVAKKGFGEGWDAYRNHIHEGGGVFGENIYERGLKSVEDKREKPWFLYLGTIDTHVSWRAKQPWMKKYDPEPYNGKYVDAAMGTDIDAMAKQKIVPSERDRKRIVAIYDSNVSYQDDLLGKLFAQLEAWGILEDTMVIVTADHGDEQWEVGRVGHGASVRESLVHVPLAIYYPPLFPAGKVDEGVDTVDILPTLLDAMGLAPPEEAQGESLIALAQGAGGRGYPRPSFTSMYENWFAMRLAGWKLVVGGEVRLYDIAADPDEGKVLTDERPIERRFMTDAMSTFIVYQKEWKKSRWGVASNMSPQAPADLDRR